jgi:hypothetical protein
MYSEVKESSSVLSTGSLAKSIIKKREIRTTPNEKTAIPSNLYP